jgi:TRIAD3 protein (E3 ubiquitin-protein ligase RNF216)
MPRCTGITKKGVQCKLNAKYNDNKYCRLHQIKEEIKHETPVEPTKPTKPIKTIKYIVKMQRNHMMECDAYEYIYDKLECSICFCEYYEHEMNRCNNGHVACNNCTKQYINTAINDQKEITCFDSICNCKYNDNTIMNVYKGDIKGYDRYTDHLRILETKGLASIVDNYSICPFCSQWGCIVENVYDGIHPQNINGVRCLVCRKSWCVICRSAYHGEESCNKLNTHDEDVIHRVVCKVIDDAVIHTCPNCRTKYSKEDGCNLMTCPSCKTYSCYLCNTVIIPKNGRKYYHFSKKTCPLYNNDTGTKKAEVPNANKRYKNEHIRFAVEKLLDANKHDDVLCIKIADTVRKVLQ